MVYEELLKQAEMAEAKPLPLDQDLPGMGQFYCLLCDRHFASDNVREEHYKSKLHKKKEKQRMVPAPDQEKQAEMAEAKPLPPDQDLPGMGQFYCRRCDLHFASDNERLVHYKSKVHKKKKKQLKGSAPHTQKKVKLVIGLAPHMQLDADLAAGMGMPDNGPKLMSM
jgi:bud site selection protein 20